MPDEDREIGHLAIVTGSLDDVRILGVQSAILMKRPLLLLTFALALLLNTPAVAYTPAQNLAAALPIAQAAWPKSPCHGRETVKLTDQLDDLNAAGEAVLDGSCQVLIRPTRDRYDFCNTLVHEFGHLAVTTDHATGQPRLPDGRTVDSGGHTHDGSVMDPDGGFYGPCGALSPPVTPRQAAADTYGIPASSCRLARVTEKPRGRVYRCGHRRPLLVHLRRNGEVDYVTSVPRRD